MAAPSMIASVTTSPQSPRSHKSPTGTPRVGISLRSPITSSERKLWDDPDGHEPSHNIPQGCPHAFRPPAEGESRGPCPALNTLANHGYLPRNGHKITTEDLLAALQNPETYNLSGPLAGVLVYGGLLMMRERFPIPLHELARHNRIEHSSSMVHKDTATGNKFAPTRCDTLLLDGLLDNHDFLTLEHVARRRVELEKVSPLDPIHQEVARGEWALVLGVFGQAYGGKVPSDMLRIWLKENRFPEEWKPTHEQGLFSTVKTAGAIHKEMNDYRQHHEDLADGYLAENELAGELKSEPENNKAGSRRLKSLTPPPPPTKRRRTITESVDCID